jgi:solute carrier family 25 S-adenosylmethionine transporter 26
MAINDLLGNMLSGGIAGSTVETALYPLDTIKTRLQARTSVTSIQLKGLYSGLAGNIVGVIPSSPYSLVLMSPSRNSSPGSLSFRAFLPSLSLPILSMPIDLLSSHCSLLPSGYSSVAQLSAAAAAGTIASLVRVPTEVIKTRMQTKQFNGPIMAVSSIAAKEGVGGLYAGYWSFMLRDLPFDAIEFVTYEQAKIAYSRFIVKRDVNPAEASFLGAFAGSFTGVVTTPLDVVKTRLMTQGLKAQYAGVFDCMGKIARSEGIGALFKGGAARATWLSLGGSIFFTSLETSQALLVSEKGRKQQGGH